MLALVTGLAELRERTPALQTGAQRMLDRGAGVLAWERALDDERWLAAVNFGSAPVALPGGEVVLRTGGATGALAPDEGVLARVR